MKSVNESNNYPAALREILKRVIYDGKAKNQTEIANAVGVTKGQLSLAASKGIGLSPKIVNGIRKKYGMNVYTYFEDAKSQVVETTPGSYASETEKRLISLEATQRVLLMKLVNLLSANGESEQKVFQSLAFEIEQTAKLLSSQSRT
jgi:hypothetical protein